MKHKQKTEPLILIFLDVDGVIRIIENNHLDVSRRCVKVLNRLFRMSGAKLVVSSSWRAHKRSPLSWLFSEWGIQAPIFGMTPDADEIYHGLFLDLSRTEEIRQWLRDCPVEISSILILDDDPIEGPLSAYHLQTDVYTGLTGDHLGRAQEILALPYDRRLLDVEVGTPLKTVPATPVFPSLPPF